MKTETTIGLTLFAGGRNQRIYRNVVESREIALQRMTEKAETLKADAIINIRFMTSSIMGGAAEIFAYGTALTLT